MKLQGFENPVEIFSPGMKVVIHLSLHTTAGMISSQHRVYIPLMKCPPNLLDCDDQTFEIGMIGPIARVFSPLFSHAIDLLVVVRSTKPVSPHL